MSRIRPVKNLRDYFRQSVARSMQRNDIDVDEQTSCYVVNLLTLYSRSEALFEDGENGPELKPVALVLANAIDRGREEMRRALKRVGDQSLFMAGFFGESLNTRAVDLDYYVNMGGAAYATLSENVARSARETALSQVFAELAEHFIGLVDVLTDLLSRSRADERDLLRLYETWMRTGSPRAERLLRAEGIEPEQRLRQPGKPH